MFALALAGISTGLSIFSSFQQGDAKARQSEMNADAARSDAASLRATAGNTRREADMQDLSTELFGINVETARRNAGLMHMQAEAERASIGLTWARQRIVEGRIEEEGRKTLAGNRVFFAGNNLDTSTGSPLLSMGQTAARVALDIDLSRATAHIEAVDGLKRAANLEAAAAGETDKALASIYSQLASSMKAESQRVLAVSQDARAGSFDRRAEGYMEQADDARTGAWFGAAQAALSGGASINRLWPSSGMSIDVSSIWNPASGRGN